MEPQGLLSCPQEPASDSSPELDASSPHIFTVFL
jgi:hypothetical protein